MGKLFFSPFTEFFHKATYTFNILCASRLHTHRLCDNKVVSLPYLAEIPFRNKLIEDERNSPVLSVSCVNVVS